jgi:hypothetical protein
VLVSKKFKVERQVLNNNNPEKKAPGLSLLNKRRPSSECSGGVARRSKSGGYFSPERFRGRVEEELAHELALKPDCFPERTDQENCSTLVH